MNFVLTGGCLGERHDKVYLVRILIHRCDVTLSVWGGCSTMHGLMELREGFYVITPRSVRYTYVQLRRAHTPNEEDRRSICGRRGATEKR